MSADMSVDLKMQWYGLLDYVLAAQQTDSSLLPNRIPVMFCHGLLILNFELLKLQVLPSPYFIDKKAKKEKKEKGEKKKGGLFSFSFKKNKKRKYEQISMDNQDVPLT